MRSKQGFTLAEIIIVVAIMSIIAGIVLFNVSTASKIARDGDRQADLRTLQSAVELYKQKHGKYPAGCNVPNTWSGEAGTAYACGSGNQYILGNADTTDWDGDGNITEIFTFSPEFIPALPRDKRLNGANSGYVYTTNVSRTVYKIMAKRTVESEVVTNAHPFKSCDADFANTYAVWGGYAPAGDPLNEDIDC